MGERAWGGGGGAALSHPPPSGAPQTGPVWGRLRSRPQPGTAALLPARRHGPPAPTPAWGARLGSSARGWWAQPEPGGARSGGVSMPVAAAAGGRTSEGCVPPAASEPGQTPLFHPRTRKPAAARGNGSSAASPRAEPHAGVLREPRSSAGAHGARMAAPGPGIRSAAHTPSALLATPRALGHASRQELPAAGRGEGRSQPPAPRGSCCSRGHSAPCSRCCAEPGSRRPSSSGQPRALPGGGRILPRSAGLPGCCSRPAPSPAVPRLEGKRGWQQGWALAPRNPLPAQPSSGRAGMPQRRGEGGLSATAAEEGRATLLGHAQTLSGA